MFLVLFREGFSVDRLGLSAFAGSFVALVLMPGYQVCEEQTGEKIGVIQGGASSCALSILHPVLSHFSYIEFPGLGLRGWAGM